MRRGSGRGGGAGLALAVVGMLTSCGPNPSSYLAAGRAPDPAELEALRERLIENSGGAERLRSLSVVVTQDAYVTARGGSMTNRARRNVLLRGDGRFRMESDQNGVKDQMALARDGAALAMAGAQPKPVEGPSAQLVHWQYKGMLPICILIRDDARLVAGAPVERDGRRLVPVEVTDPRKPPVTLYIEPEGPSGPLIRSIEATLPISAINAQLRVSLDVRQDYDDFQRVEGVLWPFKICNYSDGQKVAVVDTIEVRPAPGLTEDDFLIVE